MIFKSDNDYPNKLTFFKNSILNAENKKSKNLEIDFDL